MDHNRQVHILPRTHQDEVEQARVNIISKTISRKKYYFYEF